MHLINRKQFPATAAGAVAFVAETSPRYPQQLFEICSVPPQARRNDAKRSINFPENEKLFRYLKDGVSRASPTAATPSSTNEEVGGSAQCVLRVPLGQLKHNAIRFTKAVFGITRGGQSWQGPLWKGLSAGSFGVRIVCNGPKSRLEKRPQPRLAAPQQMRSPVRTKNEWH